MVKVGVKDFEQSREGLEELLGTEVVAEIKGISDRYSENGRVVGSVLGALAGGILGYDDNGWITTFWAVAGGAAGAFIGWKIGKFLAEPKIIALGEKYRGIEYAIERYARMV